MGRSYLERFGRQALRPSTWILTGAFAAFLGASQYMISRRDQALERERDSRWDNLVSEAEEVRSLEGSEYAVFDENGDGSPEAIVGRDNAWRAYRPGDLRFYEISERLGFE